MCKRHQYQSLSTQTLGLVTKQAKPAPNPQSASHSLLVCPLLCTAMDDTWAIALILSRPDVFDVKLICTSTGNSTARARVRVCVWWSLSFKHQPTLCPPRCFRLSPSCLMRQVAQTSLLPLGTHKNLLLVGSTGCSDITHTLPQPPFCRSNHTTPRFGPPVGAEEFWADDYPLSRYPGTVYADGLPVFLSHLRITQTPVLILEIAPPVSLAAIIGIGGFLMLLQELPRNSVPHNTN